MSTHLLRTTVLSTALCAVLLGGCKKEPAASAAPASAPRPKVGVVTDVGGRGDQSFNDSALRGLELWAAGKVYGGGRYRDATREELQASLGEELSHRTPPIAPVGVEPLVLQSKVQEDYEPNLQLLVDQGANLAVGVGYMLEPAVEVVAQRNPDARFLLIDSPVVDGQGRPVQLPNVRTVVFREHEGSFLVGALAGLVTKSGKVGFVGGAQVPLIQRFEAGFRAGVLATRPDAAASLLSVYTGSFDNVAAGKQVAQDLIAKGADVVFHAAGSDGLGVIQAVREARAAGRQVWAIGVDSDQAHLAPDAVLTSMVKRVDLAVYETARALAAGTWSAGDASLGLKEGGVGMAPVRVDFPGKAEVLARVEALRQRVAAGELKVPATPAELASFKVSP